MKFFKLLVHATAIVTLGITTVSAQNADEIMQKHIAAAGGTENWNKVTSMKATGSMNINGMDISMSQTTVNNVGMRMDISAMGMNGYTIITPKEGWFYQPGMETPMALPVEQLKIAQDKLNIQNGQMVDRSKIEKLEYMGSQQVNNATCHKIKVTDKTGAVQTAFIDASTYYILRVESIAKVEDQEQEIAINYSNYKQLPEGVVMPMTVSTTQGDITFTTVELNKPVDEKLFVLDVAKKDADPKKN